jgi:hypothetical protein
VRSSISGDIGASRVKPLATADLTPEVLVVGVETDGGGGELATCEPFLAEHAYESALKVVNSFLDHELVANPLEYVLATTPSAGARCVSVIERSCGLRPRGGPLPRSRRGRREAEVEDGLGDVGEVSDGLNVFGWRARWAAGRSLRRAPRGRSPDPFRFE